jgi:adenylylsulfate kinase-like enzyme
LAALGFCVWLTGLPRSGKSTIANELAPLLRARGWQCVVLDREEAERRLGPESTPGEDPAETVAARVAYVAELLVRNGNVPVVAVSNFLASTRARARLRVPRFVEVYVTTPAYVCQTRRSSRPPLISLERLGRPDQDRMDAFEPPTNPEISVGTLDRTPHQSAEWVLRELDRLGLAPSLVAKVESAPPASTQPPPRPREEGAPEV